MSEFFVQKMLVLPPFRSLIFAFQQLNTPGTNAGYVLPVLLFLLMPLFELVVVAWMICEW